MLKLFQELTDTLVSFLAEDPVRPHIPHADRVGDHKAIFVFQPIPDKIDAITCVSFQDAVPSTESDLFSEVVNPIVAVFYTIWSYSPGTGRQLLFDAVQYIRESKPNIERFVTLSPKTEMARRFHLKNGAVELKVNETTVNYEYTR